MTETSTYLCEIPNLAAIIFYYLYTLLSYFKLLHTDLQCQQKTQ